MDDEPQPFHLKYRPSTFAEVLGNGDCVKSLQNSIKKGDQHTYLLSGPPGVGKTSLARICARELGCSYDDTTEIDGATYTGVKDMQQVIGDARFLPFGASPCKVIIIDECHRLSTAAWAALSKALQKPRKHVYWFFCTNELQQVPNSFIKTCFHVSLKPVPDSALRGLLDKVCEQEGIKLADGVGDVMVKEAHGAPRAVLVNLATAYTVKDRDAAYASLHVREDESEQAAKELVTLILGGRGSSDRWKRAMEIVSNHKLDPEAVRTTVLFRVCDALGREDDLEIQRFYMTVLKAFKDPYQPERGDVPLLQSIARLLLPARSKP